MNEWKTPGLTPAVSKRMADQVPLAQAADRIRALANEDPGSGFAAVVLDTPARGIMVRWKGAVPADVVAELDRDRDRGIAVTVVEARYSEKECLAEARRLGGVLFGVKAENGDVITSVGPNSDFSGLMVTLAPGAGTADEEKRVVRALSPAALAARARAAFPGLVSDMPITVAFGRLYDPLIGLAD